MVLLLVAFDSSMEQYETQMERSDLHIFVDGISASLASLGIHFRIQGLECLHPVMAGKLTIFGCKHCHPTHGYSSP